VIARSELPDAAPQQSRAATPRDVFISYARVDHEFVQGMCESLEAAGVPPWVDVEGLFAGEEFWPEVCRAIDAAPAFVFVITPESVISSFCLRELAHAHGARKRIVPVCRRNVVASSVPEAAASPQWVFFRDADDTSRATSDLVAAIRADWAWLRALARLHVQATEWHAGGRNTASMLRGAALADAEALLTESASRASGLTAVQRDFVRMSREHVRRRRRRLALVSVIGAAALAYASARATLGYFDRKNAGARELAVAPAEVISELQQAERLCNVLPVFHACATILINVAAAYYEMNEDNRAIDRYSRLIARLEGRESLDLQEMLARAYQSRSMLQVTAAEALADVSARTRLYQLAEGDFEHVSRIRERVPLQSGATPLAMTRARLLVARSRYAEALDELATIRPEALEDKRAVWDLRMLLALAHNCNGDGYSAYDAYIQSLPEKRLDPHWRKNAPYFRAMVTRCASNRN
jgi:hypothetical protein